MLRIKLIKSPIGNTRKNRLTVAALGLRKVSQTVDHDDHPSIRGMIHKVKHLLSVEEVEGGKTTSKPEKAPKQAAEPKPAKASKPAAKPKAAPAKAKKPAKAKASAGDEK